MTASEQIYYKQLAHGVKNSDKIFRQQAGDPEEPTLQFQFESEGLRAETRWCISSLKMGSLKTQEEPKFQFES